ncbi:hypothetical protein EV359DRAFT_75404 [Lentinula novae-zelandiae]|nr:hypothetical protein EV359DRAFT_75404 [Lentinula novae-zelandiae]
MPAQARFKDHACPYCGKKFATLQGLRSHTSQVSVCQIQSKKTVNAESIPVIPIPAAQNNGQDQKHANVEEVDDDPSSTYDPKWIYEESYPRPAGTPVRPCQTSFEIYREQQKADGSEPWEPFQSQDEWELACWLMESGASQTKIDSFLRLNKIRNNVKPNFKDKRAFFRTIDLLPTGPSFSCTPMEVMGNLKDTNGENRTEVLELWHRDILECISELMGNPAFNEKQEYAPRREFREMKNGIPCNRQYSEMWTANWWWNVQDKLPEDATVAPIILASDETQLSTFSGDKKAWPKMIQPLIDKGLAPTEMACSDGFIRSVYALLAVYIADYPEQCRIACCKRNSCPQCTITPKKRGCLEPANSIYREPVDISQGYNPSKFKTLNMLPINPFWKDLPLCHIFECMTPDLLHQMHRGVFADHSIANGDEEIDARFRTMPPHPTLCHFRKGISKVFLGTLGGAADARVIRVVRAAEDYMYYSHFESHCEESLEAMEAAWKTFHTEKEVFVELGVRNQFNISKVHNVLHYPQNICSRGTLDGFNSETTERLHIDLAKAGYRASNKRRYIVQMTQWLQRQEAVQRFASYLQWAIPGYIAELSGVANDEDEDSTDSTDGSEEAELHPVKYTVARRPPLQASVTSIENDYEADWFTWYLDKFLTNHGLASKIPINIQHGLNTLPPFPLYKQLRLQLPPIPEAASESLTDVVHTTKHIDAFWTEKGLVKEIPAKTSIVLVRVMGNDPSKGPLHGIQVAHVRLLFRLPSEIASFHHPLAYVQWFKPFQKDPVKDLNLFKLSYSFQQHYPHCSIIPVTQIIQTCHLYPAYGRSVDATWTSDNILDKCSSFYLNVYLRHRDFLQFRHRISMFIKSKEDEVIEFQKKRARRA